MEDVSLNCMLWGLPCFTDCLSSLMTFPLPNEEAAVLSTNCCFHDILLDFLGTNNHRLNLMKLKQKNSPLLKIVCHIVHNNGDLTEWHASSQTSVGTKI